MCGVIVVDAESFRSTWHKRDAYIHNHCLGYRHNFALFYQLLDSNLFTHHMISFKREASSETYGPRVYFSSYIFRSINQKTQKYLTAIYLLLFVLRFSNLLYLSLSDLIFASDCEWIDNPFIALGASVWLFVQVHRLETCLYLLLDWYLGSQTEGNTYATVLHHPFLFKENQHKLKT